MSSSSLNNNNTKSRKRSHEEIIYEMLESISTNGREGRSKTQITQSAYLNHKQIKDFTLLLTNLNLIETKVDGYRILYTMTDKGQECFRLLQDRNDLLRF